MTPNPLSFNETVYLWRKERGLTQGELAQRAGISRPNLSVIEQGGREITLDTLRRIAKALDLRPGILVDGIAPQNESVKLKRENLDSITRYLLGEKISLTGQEMKFAELIRGCMKQKLGFASSYGRRLPRTARDEKYKWEQLKTVMSSSDLKNLLSRFDKRSLYE